MIFVAGFLNFASCASDSEDESSKSDIEIALEYCDVVCQNIATRCPDIASELPSDHADCRNTCVQGDEPEGQHQPLSYLECIASAPDCSEFNSCKLKD